MMTPHEPADRNRENDNQYGDLVETLSDVFGRLMSYATAEWINVEISTAQIKVLFVLHFGGTHTVNQIAEKLNIGQPTASHLVEKLVQASLASRIESKTDRRVSEIDLTTQGHDLADRLSGISYKWVIAEWVSQLTADQQTALGDGLHALLAVIEDTSQ